MGIINVSKLGLQALQKNKITNFLVGGLTKFIAKPSLKAAPMAALDVASIALPAARISKVGKIYQYSKAILPKVGAYISKTPWLKTIGAVGLGSYAATGKLPDVSLRSIAGYSGAKLSLGGSAYGAVSGIGGEAVDYFKGKLDGKNIMDYIKPSIPSIPPQGFSSAYANDAEYGLQRLKDQIGNVPYSNPFNLQLGQPSFELNMPSSGGGFGGGLIAPSSIDVNMPSIGGGLSPEMLMLALALTGGGGYLLGRKKRKKRKKYKKKRKLSKG